MTTTTLVTSVTINTRDGVTHMNDVPLAVERGHRTIAVHLTARHEGQAVTIRLSGAERIALIEALGGKDAP